MCAMPIGELSRRTGTPVATIRYYESVGLMPEPARSASGRRLYGREDQARLEAILIRRSLGYALKDISAALKPATGCERNLDLARRQLDDIQRQIARLKAAAAILDLQISGCSETCQVTVEPGCPILPTYPSRALTSAPTAPKSI